MKNILKTEINNEKLKNIALYLLAFFVPLILLIGIFIKLGIYPLGDNTYLPVDAYGQYVNYLQYFRDLFFGNSSIIYSLSKSLGGEMYGVFAYYLISPFNFVTLLFEKGNMAFAFDIILILKISTSSLTFIYYLNKKYGIKFSNLIFSLMYAFSGYIIAYGFNIMWLDGVILLPLVILGLERIVEGKKAISYIVFLCLTLITNYYIGFMVCIFCVIYFVYILLQGSLKNKKEVFKKIGIFLLYSICAALIAAIILIPVFIGLQDGRADFSFSSISLEKNFDIQNLLSKFFTNSFNIEEIKNNAMPPIFCGVLANVLVLAYFFNSKIKIKEKILSLLVLIIFAVSFYIKGINLLWSMGNIPAWYIYRYAFCFIFMYITLAKRGFDNIKEGMKWWKMAIIAIIYVIIAIIVLKMNIELIDENAVKFDIALAIVFSILLLLTKVDLKESTKKVIGFLKKNFVKIIIGIIFILSTANLVYNATCEMEEIRENGGGVDQNTYGIVVNAWNRIISNLKEYDTGLYRTESKIHLVTNDAITFEYNGLTYSGSAYSEKLYTFLERLGIRRYHVQVMSNLENTETVDMLLGIKYLIVTPEKVLYKDYILEYEDEYLINDVVEIYSNPYSLSLGYVVSEKAFETNMDNNDTFALQNEMVKNMTELDKDIYTEHEGEITETLDKVEKEGTTYKLTEEGGSVTFEFEAECDGNAYIYMSARCGNQLQVYINGEKTAAFGGVIRNETINTGAHEIGEKVTVKIEMPEDLDIYEMYLYYEDEETLKEHYEILSETQVDLEQIDNRTYEGTVTIENDYDYVMFTIPYEEGWTVTIDGEEVEYEEIFDALIAVKVEEGEHVIRLEYLPSGLATGAILSFAGIILFIIIIIFKKQPIR